MNRKNLVAAVLAGLAEYAGGVAGSAQSVVISSDGLARVLIYPYYFAYR